MGEATNWPGCPMIESAVQEMKPFLVGRDPLEIEPICQHLARRFQYIGMAGVVPGAISGIEIALWDIMGKRLSVPVWRLLGGCCQPEVPVYANYWAQEINFEPDPQLWAEAARKTVGQGYRALKFTPVPFPPAGALNRTVSKRDLRLGVERVAVVREAVGRDVELYVEMAGKYDVPTAIRICRALEEFDIGFVEEPVPPESPEAMAYVRRGVRMPVAAGERLFGRGGFRPFFEAGALDIAQPDVMRTGGLSEARRIASMAEAYHLPVAPHNAGGPVGTIATLHLCTAVPNLHSLEFRVGDVPWRDAVISPPIRISEGVMSRPDGPGLGIELNEGVVREHPHRPVSGDAFM